jgi:hypothetical protein
MTKGVEICDVVVGSGEEAQDGKRVVLNLRMFLHRGDEVSVYPSPKVTIDLQGRPCIAGLRNGIIGMRVGGKRTILIAPHLAYGANGLPGKVPPNALLRCEVELLQVRQLFVPDPEDLPPDRHVVVYHPGEAARNLPRWQFGISENGHCGATLYFPIPGMTWRHTRKRSFQENIEPAKAEAALNDAANLPAHFPTECLSTEQLWADTSEQANSITRDRKASTLCLTIDVWEKGRHNYYRMREDSPSLQTSELYRTIMSLLQPHLTADSVEHAKPQSKSYLPD